MVHLTEKDRLNLREQITSFSGLDEPIQSNRALDEAVARRVGVRGLTSFGDYWQLLQRGADGEEEMNHLVRLLTNKEAYFFREMRQFEVLRDQVLPEVLATGEQPLRIWSAGCASGEEPYSLAIALLEYQAHHGEFEAEVIATDIDLHAIAAACQRRYGERAVRRVPDDLLEKYFAFDGQTYRLIPEVAQLVRFKVHNLVRDDCPPDLNNLDVVFCRNVTIYFTESARDRVNVLLADSLREGGYLFVASAEAIGHNLGRLEPVSTGQILLFRKQQPPTAPPPSFPGTGASAPPLEPSSLSPEFSAWHAAGQEGTSGSCLAGAGCQGGPSSPIAAVARRTSGTGPRQSQGLVSEAITQTAPGGDPGWLPGPGSGPSRFGTGAYSLSAAGV